MVLDQAGGNVQLINPEEGVFMMLNSMSIMKNAPHKDAAVKFIEFYLSAKRQNNIMNELGISVAVNSTVPVNSEVLSKSLGDLTFADIVANAYVPDWENLMKDNGAGITNYDAILQKMEKGVKK